MVIHAVNIVGGFVLAAPKIKQWAAKEHVEGAAQKLHKFRGTIGIIALVLGALSLLGNFGIGFVYLLPYFFFGAPLQSIAAIAAGLILAANFFVKWPKVAANIAKLEKYGEWIGIAAVVIGILGLI